MNKKSEKSPTIIVVMLPVANKLVIFAVPVTLNFFLKKTTSILLLFILCVSNLCFYPLLKVIQLHAKEVAKIISSTANTSNLVIFTDIQNDKNVVWDSSGKEFSYKGRMYDIAKEEDEDGIRVFYCYDDKAETEIAHGMAVYVSKQIENNKQHSKNTVAHFVVLLAQLFLPTEIYEINRGFFSIRSILNFNWCTTYYPGFNPAIPHPPPWA